MSKRDSSTAANGGASSVGATKADGNGGGGVGRLQLKGVLDGLVKRSINEDK